jgi:hypothetical protein
MVETVQELDLNELERRGALVRDGNRLGVRVMIHEPADLSGRSMPERREHLAEEFRSLSKTREFAGVCFDLDRVSVSGQSVCAVIPVELWKDIFVRLDDCGLKVDFRVKYKAVAATTLAR